MKIYLSPANHHKPYIVTGYTEKNEMEKVAKSVQTRLSKYDCEVYYPTVFNSAQNYVGRPEEAKKLGADVYVSIHSNATANVGEKAAGAIGFYHPNNSNSKKLAENIVAQLDAICPIENTRWQPVEDGMAFIPGYGLGEIREPYNLGITSVLIETNFHSYEPTAKWIINNIENIAQAITTGIVNTYGLKLKTNTSSNTTIVSSSTNNTTSTSKTLYRVQAGAYVHSALNYATEASKRLAEKGYTNAIFKNATHYKIQVGAFSIKSNADNLVKELKLAGFDSFITTNDLGTMVTTTTAKYKEGSTVYFTVTPCKATKINDNTIVNLGGNVVSLNNNYKISKLYAGKAILVGLEDYYIDLDNLSLNKVSNTTTNSNTNSVTNSNNTATGKYPFDNGKFRVTSIYGYRMFYGVYEKHDGIDLVGIDTSEVTAVHPGTVVRSRIVTETSNKTSEWGNYVAVQSSIDKTIHYYCHLAERYVNVGDVVKVGTPLGKQGNTGKTTGIHLHYQVTNSSGTLMDPSKVLGINNKEGTYNL